MINEQSGITIASYQYTVLPSGHRQTASEALAAASGPRGLGRSYGYDSTYRLTVENLATAGITNLPASATVGYTLDDVGNRLSRNSTLPGVSTTANTFDANDRLNTDSYDANGNTIGSALGTDAYDFEDRLIRRNNGEVVIVYDGDGNRVRKTVAGVTTLFLVEDQNPTGYAQVVEELTSTGGPPQITRVYVYGNDLISQDQFDGATWTASFYGYDGHGNVRYLTDLTGVVTDAYDYDAFGDLVSVEGTTPNFYLYMGEQFDEELQLFYLRARWLDAASGRFRTMDPFEGFINDPPSLHKYIFVGVDPVNGVDPSGYLTLNEVMIALHNQIKLRQPQIQTGRRAYEATKKALCGAGRLTFTAGLAYYGGHHIFPKYAGGPLAQKLAKLNPELHKILHRLIHVLVKDDPLLKELSALGGPTGSKDAWAEALSDPKKAKRYFEILKKATKAVDKYCGFKEPFTMTRELELMLK